MNNIIRLLILFFIFSFSIQQALSSSTETTQRMQKITISAIGDCTLGRNYKMDYSNSWDEKFKTEGEEYFLKNVSSILKNDNLSIANLEGVLSSSTKRQSKIYNQKYNKIV